MSPKQQRRLLPFLLYFFFFYGLNACVANLEMEHVCVCMCVCTYVCVCAIFNLKTDENTISILIVRVIVANIT